MSLQYLASAIYCLTSSPLPTHNALIDKMVDNPNDSLLSSAVNGFQYCNFDLLARYQFPILGSFNGHSLMQVGQKVCSVLTMDSLQVDVRW